VLSGQPVQSGRNRVGGSTRGLTRQTRLYSGQPDYDPGFFVSCSCRVRGSCQKLPTLLLIFQMRDPGKTELYK
jgi:hypothetical protein